MAAKRYLFTPGPTPVPPQVLEAMSRPIIHHRARDFRELFQRCLGRLREVFRTDGDVLVYASSGSGVMESTVTNLCAPGTRALVVSAGHFGERWAALARAYGCDVEVLSYDWGETPSADDLAGRLDELGEIEIVFLTHSETSTGVVADIRSLASTAKEAGAIVAVDAISSLGAVALDTDAWGIDVVCSGSQKALMTPPGLGLVSVSERAWERAGGGGSPRFYFDWERARKAHAKQTASFTPAVSLLVGLDVALGLLLEEGLEATFERHARLGRACREGAKAMGLELFSPDDDSSAVVTAIRAPDGTDSTELVAQLRDRHGITLADGQGELQGKVFRIGHIGFYDVFDITTALAGVELVLTEIGADIERGAAVTRALETYESATRV